MISPAEVQEALPGLKDASVVPTLIADVVAQWEAATRGLWAYRTGHVETVQVDGFRPRSLWLHLCPIASIAKVEVLSEDDFEETDSWRLSGERELVCTGGLHWPEEVRVTYTGGYGPSTEACGVTGVPRAPADVVGALLTQIRFLQARLSTDKIASRSVAVADAGTAGLLAPDLHPLFAAAAARHRRHA